MPEMNQLSFQEYVKEVENGFDIMKKLLSKQLKINIDRYKLEWMDRPYTQKGFVLILNEMESIHYF